MEWEFSWVGAIQATIMSASFNNYITLLKQKPRKNIEMMCYKDKTWCSHSYECMNRKCDRNLRDEEISSATQWWGGLDFPICYGDFKTENCGFIQINGDELLEKLD